MFRLAAEQPRQVAGQQVLVFTGHYDDTPGEGLGGSGLGDIVLAGLDYTLQHVVAALLHLFGIRGEYTLKGRVAVLVGQEHAGVIQQVALRDADLHACRGIQGDGEEGQAAALPFAELRNRIGGFEGVEELAFVALAAPADVGNEALGVLSEAESRLLRHHVERSLAVRHEAVGGAVVVGPEDDAVALAAEREFVVCLMNLSLTVDYGGDVAVDAAADGLADLHVAAEHDAVVQGQGKGRRLQHRRAVHGYRPCSLRSGRYLHLQLAGGGLQFVHFLRRAQVKSHAGEQDCQDEISIHFY